MIYAQTRPQNKALTSRPTSAEMKGISRLNWSTGYYNIAYNSKSQSPFVSNINMTLVIVNNI